MEFTNEIKLKVFAQYIGQNIELDNDGSKVRNRKLIAVGGIDDEEYLKLRMGESKKGFTHICLMKNNDCKLILKPLQKITDEDAVEVGYSMFLNEKGTVPKNDLIIWVKHDLNSRSKSCKLNYECYQYLQSKGYDLPQYLLGGKTLEEAELAVYE